MTTIKMLPKNFTFYITGRDELKYFAEKDINYFIGFHHPGCHDPYTKYDILRYFEKIEVFKFFEVHDAYTDEHKNMGLKMPNRALIDDLMRIFEIIKEEVENGKEINVLFGCMAGISRSTAACYILLCYLLGEWNEREAFNLLVNKRLEARPNPLMVKLADDYLKRGGKMVAPLKNYLEIGGEKDDDILLF